MDEDEQPVLSGQIATPLAIIAQTSAILVGGPEQWGRGGGAVTTVHVSLTG